MTFLSITSTPSMALVPGHPMIDMTPMTTDIPDGMWHGLQFWLEPSSYAGVATPPYAVVGPDAAGNFSGRLIDQSRRLAWLDAAGVRQGIATYYNPVKNQLFIPQLSTALAGINGRPALLIDRTQTGLFVPQEFGLWPDWKPGLAQLLTDSYTLVAIASMKAVAVGGIFSTGSADAAHTDATCGMRLGFSEPGRLLYQHSAAASDRVIVDCPVADDRPMLFIVTARRTPAGTHDGRIRVVTGGTVIDKSFSFAGAIKWDGLAGPVPHWGSQGPGAGNATLRKLGALGRTNRFIGDDEFERLTLELRARRGPF
ncbi:hypothetical protein KV697_05985 [Sphingomonas sanguinis]|uniref:hypothetical protein n=1 Tax=Sphingomonas sanguinis TaxID=33051 RepID=UPI001C598ED4|nr:hypothetical protein [Sphingomonas sanguinis]QXT36849.1 hypothetical protein KV697_05985 [Sphingomonas sanguinis]